MWRPMSNKWNSDKWNDELHSDDPRLMGLLEPILLLVLIATIAALLRLL